ncbi:MAG: O-antigen ligase family protein [Candidatus Levybacteria bacterium]|nr:O-antigen ligase family protein [Candidatus Levybacteria bacterium]
MPAIDKLQKIIFFGIVFFVSSQVGLHFWPEFAKVGGIRIDYLSPTLYLLDILIIALFLVSLPEIRRFVRHIRKAKLPKLLLSLFILSLFWNLSYSKSLGTHVFGIIKLLEFSFLGSYIALEFQKRDIRTFTIVLSLSAVVSSVLAVWQFILQSSVGGLWYFFGERTFNISTIGISTVNLDQQILRPYAAFPHPNVLAFFFLATTVFTVLRLPYEKNSLVKFLFVASILLSTVGLFLTFSRITILIAICLFIYAIYTNGKRNIVLAVLGFLGLLGLVNIFFSLNIFRPEFILRGIDFRQELLAQSLQIFLNNPYFGIGLNNFFIHQSVLIRDVSPILFQPPHNIFVIAPLSLGIFGWWIFPALFILAILSLFTKLRTTNNELNDFYRSVLFVLLGTIIVGMFDHFFLTLEQGQIIFSLILGLSFVRFKM